MSAYRDEYGRFAPPPDNRVPWVLVNVQAEWNRWAWRWYSVSQQRRDEFLDRLREMTNEPEKVDEIIFCSDCYVTIDGSSVEYPTSDDDHPVCGSCHNYYRECAHCQELSRNHSNTLSGAWVCSGCQDSYYSYCEECDGYYDDEDSGEHNHDRSACCESPARTFVVRNDGAEALPNDTRVTISLPKGEISTVGLQTIANYIRYNVPWSQTTQVGHGRSEWDAAWQVAWHMDQQIDSLGGPQWQTRQGNFAKRLSRFAYNQYALKIPAAVLSEVGNLAREHSAPVDHAIEVTRDLNLPREEFAHSGSCWWSEYAESRCAFKTNGGFALRTFNEDNALTGSGVSGRAWVLPLKSVVVTTTGPRQWNEDTCTWGPGQSKERTRLVPTFDTVDPAALVVFNGYGDLSGYLAARIMAHMYGWTYRKIAFEAPPMYVNSGGYLIAPEEIASTYTDGALDLVALDEHANLYNTERKELANA